MFGDDVKENKLAFHIGDGFGEGDEDSVGVGRFDAFKEFGVDRKEGEVFLCLIEVVGIGDVGSGERFAIVPGDAVGDVIGVDETIIGDVYTVGEFEGVTAVGLKLIHRVVDEFEESKGFGEHGRSRIQCIRTASPTDARCLGGVWTAGLLGYLLDFNKPGFAKELATTTARGGSFLVTLAWRRRPKISSSTCRCRASWG
jgi:hypothetical protein